MLHCGNTGPESFVGSVGLCMAGMHRSGWLLHLRIPIFAVHNYGFRRRTMLINLLLAARNAFAGWRRRQRAYDELMALDDRSLADIGIRRSEIPAVVEGFHERTRASSTASGAAPGLSPRHALFGSGEHWLPRI
jgi:uncharacterized protein YjiS (DUF1127 family)